MLTLLFSSLGRYCKFQFHAGSIKCILTAKLTGAGSTSFQFHAGSIKCEMDGAAHCAGAAGFQFHAGSIKWEVRMSETTLKPVIVISIPRWFD